MNDVIIGMGSNINPETNIEKALSIIQTRFEIVAKSQFTQTKPIGYKNQADFLNGAVRIKTGLSFTELKGQLRQIEADLGRKRGLEKYGPREIDLDIIIWNNKVADPDFYNRDFLKNSVLEIKPDLS